MKVSSNAMTPEEFREFTQRMSKYLDLTGCKTEKSINKRIKSKNSAKLNGLIQTGFAFRLILESWHNPHRARNVEVSQLTWAYWSGDEWVTVESVIDENGYLNARTDHFSTWTITEVTSIEEPASETLPDSEHLEEPQSTRWMLYTGIALVIVAAVIISQRMGKN